MLSGVYCERVCLDLGVCADTQWIVLSLSVTQCNCVGALQVGESGRGELATLPFAVVCCVVQCFTAGAGQSGDPSCVPKLL
jgi:hypothetical protein